MPTAVGGLSPNLKLSNSLADALSKMGGGCNDYLGYNVNKILDSDPRSLLVHFQRWDEDRGAGRIDNLG